MDKARVQMPIIYSFFAQKSSQIRTGAGGGVNAPSKIVPLPKENILPNKWEEGVIFLHFIPLKFWFL